MRPGHRGAAGAHARLRRPPAGRLRRCGSAGSRSVAARRPAGRVLALGDDLDAVPGQAVRAGLRPAGQVGAGPSCATPRSCPGRRSSTGSRVLITHLGSIIAQNAPRLLGREDVRVLDGGRQAGQPVRRRRAHPGAAHARRGAASAAGSARRGDLDPGPRCGSTRRSRCAPRSAPTSSGLVEAARLALGPALTALYAHDGMLRVITLEPDARAAPRRVAAPHRPAPSCCSTPDRLDGGRSTCAAPRSGRGGASGPPSCCVRPALRPAVRRLVATGDATTGGALLRRGHRCPVCRSSTVGMVTGVHAIAA